jgi:4-hydroxybenzoate polyprenyltransferase
MSEILKTAKNYLSLVRFSHTIFAMPFAITGFVMAVSDDKNTFSIKLLLLVILCMVFARNAAMGFNRIVDLRYDSKNPRTSNREIPVGKIGVVPASIFVAINVILFIAATWFINRLTFYLSPVALIVILGYSLTKRVTSLCHFILGTGLSLAPVGAYISVTGQFDLMPVILSLIVLSWSSGFDIIYSLQDDEFDRVNKLHSLPSEKGRKRALMISVIVHCFTFLLVIAEGFIGDFGYLYWAGATVFTALLIYQHYLVKPDDLSRVDLAFGTTNGYASILFSVFVILDLLL